MELNPLVIGCNCFRPLSGNYISQCYKASLRKSTHIHVSVPCRGTTFLNSNERLTVKSVSKFPSPVGELHFSITKYITIVKTFLNVSVPCRGTTFLNVSNATVLRHMDMLFPSPVGELHFSIIMAKKQYTIIKSFPSPVGELHFSISSSFVVVEVDSCFRPLSGNYISQSLGCN